MTDASADQLMVSMAPDYTNLAVTYRHGQFLVLDGVTTLGRGDTIEEALSNVGGDV